ncbi:MAG: hypothetical protein ACPGUD_02325 [Parashewanella sp.]
MAASTTVHNYSCIWDTSSSTLSKTNVAMHREINSSFGKKNNSSVEFSFKCLKLTSKRTQTEHCYTLILVKDSVGNKSIKLKNKEDAHLANASHNTFRQWVMTSTIPDKVTSTTKSEKTFTGSASKYTKQHKSYKGGRKI